MLNRLSVFLFGMFFLVNNVGDRYLLAEIITGLPEVMRPVSISVDGDRAFIS